MIKYKLACNTTTTPTILAAKLQSNETYIGHAEISKTVDPKSGEILFYLLPEYWGKGLATEIGTEIVKRAKNLANIEQLEATLDLDHFASQKVCRKIGLKFNGKGSDDGGEYLVYRLIL